MRNKLFICILFICLIVVTGCNNNKIDGTNDIQKKGNNKEDGTMNLSVKLIVNNYTYDVKLEDNATSREFIKLLPLEINMLELNGNEKYYYLDNTLPTDSYKPKKINKGDIMLYGNNCLVLFYETFNTSYSYTKIGHIDNLPNLGDGNIIIKFEK